MIETRVPKDIRQYDAKIIGPLNRRQLICASISCAASIGIFTVFKSIGISIEYVIYLVIICILPIMAFAVKIDGMTMEVYLKEVVMNYFMNPKVRYETKTFDDNGFHDPKTNSEIKKDLKRRKKLEKKNPAFKAYR